MSLHINVAVCSPDHYVIFSSNRDISTTLSMTLAQAVALRDELTAKLSVAEPADVRASMTLSDAEEAMERR